MEPVSVLLLAALASGAGGEAGKQAWTGLSELVRRPFYRTAGTPEVSSGQEELTALEQAPAETERAHALGTALATRAALDPEFHAGLEQWHGQAKQVRSDDGGVDNTITGGTFHAPVQQGRDFSGISFTTPTVSPATARDATMPRS